MHGGTSSGPPKGSQNGLKYGIYSAGLTPEEQALWDVIHLGHVDDELRVARIRLRRALIAQKSVEAAPTDVQNKAGFELSEIKKSEGAGGKKVEITQKRTDFNYIIDRLMGRIAHLEKIRMELMEGARGLPGDDDSLDDEYL